MCAAVPERNVNKRCTSCTAHSQSPKFKTVSLNETPELPFWGLNICVDFDLRDSEKMENMKKLNNILFYNKNIDIHKTV